MIPLIQFDPATLTLWYDTELAGRSRGAEKTQDAFSFALEGNDVALISLIKTIDDDWLRARCLHIASAVWHEKRHFFDFVLTNYGAFRVRQFLEVYFNIGAIIDIARRSGEKIVCPIDIYADEVRCYAEGIGAVEPNIFKIAKGVKERKEMIMSDRERKPSRFGILELGGESQFEALAFQSQIMSIQRLFGIEAVQLLSKHLPNYEALNEKYQWAARMLGLAGLVPFREISPGLLHADVTLANPIIYGALATRHWKQPQVRSEAGGTAFAAERFAALVVELSQRSRLKFNELTVIQAWELVNETAKRIFGRTVVEEITEDIAHEGDFIDHVTSEDIPPPIKKACRDFHSLRERVFRILVDDPVRVLAHERFGTEIMEKLRPGLVMCASGGQIGDPPANFEQVMGFKDPDADIAKEPYAKWWWGCTPTRWPTGGSGRDQTVFYLREKEAWMSLVSDIAPLTKLLLNGRKQSVMLGPELLFAEQRLKAQYGVELSFEKFFEYPEEDSSPDFYYFYSGYETAKCDLTSVVIKRPNGYVFGPWTLRKSPRLSKYLLDHLGGTRVAYFQLVRDWSPWIVDESQRQLVESLSSLQVESLEQPDVRRKAFSWLGERVNTFVRALRPRMRSLAADYQSRGE